MTNYYNEEINYFEYRMSKQRHHKYQEINYFEYLMNKSRNQLF